MTSHAEHGAADHLQALQNLADAADRRGLSQRAEDIRGLATYLGGKQMASAKAATPGIGLRLPAQVAHRVVLLVVACCLLLAIVVIIR